VPEEDDSMTAPVFTSVSPVYGTVDGGTAVTITGTGLTGATGLTFGAITATSIVVVSDTSITAVTPAHAAGTVNIVITTPGGTATGTNGYLYAAIPNFVNFATTVRARILAAALTLGAVQQVLDRDEDPAIIAKNAKNLPTICVIPIGAGKLTGGSSMGSSDIQEDFQQVIVGYYRQSQNNAAPYSDINLMRQYGKTAASLFSGQSNMAFNGCVIYKWTLEIQPYQEMDYVLDRWVLTMFVKSIEY
jgi:hypothetical protein